MNVGARVAWWGHSLTQRPAHSWQTQFSSLSDRRFLSKTQPTFSTVTKHCRKTKHCQTSSSQLKIISEREAQRCALAEQARLCPLWGRGAVLTTQEELPFNTEKLVPGKSFSALKKWLIHHWLAWFANFKKAYRLMPALGSRLLTTNADAILSCTRKKPLSRLDSRGRRREGQAEGTAQGGLCRTDTWSNQQEGGVVQTLGTTCDSLSWPACGRTTLANPSQTQKLPPEINKSYFILCLVTDIKNILKKSQINQILTRTTIKNEHGA